MTHEAPAYFLVADDDSDDCLFIKKAVEGSGLNINLSFVQNGEDLLHYLRREPPYTDEKKYPLPDLILLDWNMPKKNGMEALREIKSDLELKKYPVVFLTTSTYEQDILSAYKAGVNSYIQKPLDVGSLSQLIRDIDHYWIENVKLPPKN